MSWKEEEWKENLPAGALGHVTAMESSLDKLQRDISQWKFRTESLSHTTSSLKDKLKEKDKELIDKEREVSELHCKLERCIDELEKVNFMLKEKDDEIYRLSAARRKSANKDRTIMDTKSENELINVPSDDFQGCRSENALQVWEKGSEFEDDYDCGGNVDLDEVYRQQKSTIEHLEELLKQKNENLAFYKERAAVLTKENEGLVLCEKDLQEKNKDLQQKMETLHAEKVLLERRKCGLGNKCYISPRSKRHGNSVDEEDQDRCDDRCDTHQVGSYLGIDVIRPSQSDTSLATTNHHSNHELLEENIRLRNELRNLRNLPLGSVTSCKSERVVHVLSEDANANLESGIDLPSTVSDEKIQLQQEIEAKLKEVAKLRHENLEMKQVYENHMKICGNQKNEALADNRNKSPKSEVLGNLQTNVKSGFIHLQEKYTSLESMISNMASKLNWDNVSTKLDQISSIVSTENFSQNNTCPVDLAPDLDQLKNDLISTFFSVQDEMHKGHEQLDNKITSSTTEILRSIRDDEEKTVKHQNGNEKRNHMFLVSSNNSVGELETIKERLGGVQHAISESINEKRRADLEIQKLKDQLLNMVENLKRKNEELSQMTQLYEKEKGRVAENDARFRKEMAELRKEELEISEEFRNMCETLKKKDIKLANRERDIKIITVERREKEDEMNEVIMALRTEKGEVESDRDEMSRQYQEKYNECQTLLKRFISAEDQLRGIFNRLSHLEEVIRKAKTDGLY